jgi:hypothetical protein
MVQEAAGPVDASARHERRAELHAVFCADVLRKPLLDVEEDVIEGPLRRHRVGVQVASGRLDSRELRRQGLGTGRNLADPARRRAAKVDQLAVRATAGQRDHVRKAQDRRVLGYTVLDGRVDHERDGEAAVWVNAGRKRGLDLEVAQPGLFAAAEEVAERATVRRCRRVAAGRAAADGGTVGRGLDRSGAHRNSP